VGYFGTAENKGPSKERYSINRRSYLSTTGKSTAGSATVGLGLRKMAVSGLSKVPTPPQMSVGKCKFIQYKTWTNGANWTATLQSLQRSPFWGTIGIQNVSSPISVIDPDFHHVGPGPEHDDKWIQFIAWNGANVGALCHSHLNANNVSFTFEYYGSNGSWDHENSEMTFIAWDGSHWAARIDPVGVPDKGKTIPLEFTLRRA
jgi:hypothetical protein